MTSVSYQRIRIVWNEEETPSFRSVMNQVNSVTDQTAALFIVWNRTEMTAVFPLTLANNSSSPESIFPRLSLTNQQPWSKIVETPTKESRYEELQATIRSGDNFFYSLRYAEQLRTVVTGDVTSNITGDVTVTGSVDSTIVGNVNVVASTPLPISIPSSTTLTINPSPSAVFKIDPVVGSQFVCRIPEVVTVGQAVGTNFVCTIPDVVLVKPSPANTPFTVITESGNPIYVRQASPGTVPWIVSNGNNPFVVEPNAGSTWEVVSPAGLRVIDSGWAQNISSPVNDNFYIETTGSAIKLPVRGAINTGFTSRSDFTQPAYPLSGTVLNSNSFLQVSVAGGKQVTMPLIANSQTFYSGNPYLDQPASYFQPLAFGHTAIGNVPAVATYSPSKRRTGSMCSDLSQQSEPVVFVERRVQDADEFEERETGLTASEAFDLGLNQPTPSIAGGIQKGRWFW